MPNVAGRLFSSVLLILICGSVLGGEAKPVEVPEWALGVLTIRQIGGSLDKLGNYASKIYPASGELAKKFASNKMFPDVPLNAGLKADGSALIYALDPVRTGQQNERAMILPVADANAVKQALVTTLGMPSDEKGVLTFTIPQPLPNPDKTILAKFVRTNLLTAPNAVMLKALEDFLGARDAGALAASDADATFTLKVANVKQSYGDLLQQSAEVGAAKAGQTPEQQEIIKSQLNEALSTLWQTDTVEVKLSFDAEKSTAALEFGVTALADSALGKTLTGAPASVTGKLNNLLPYAPAALIAWNANGTEAAATLRDIIKKATGKDAGADAGQQADRKVADALASFVEALSGETILAFGARSGKPGAMLFVTNLREGEKLRKGLAGVYEAIVGSINARTPPEAGKDPVKVESKPPADFGGSQILSSNIIVTVPTPAPFLNGNAGLVMAKTRAAFGFSVGPTGEDAIKGMIDASNKPAPVPDDLQAAFKTLPAGTALLVLVKPISLVRAIGNKTDAVVNADKITAGLPDPAVALNVRVANRAATLRLEIPAGVPGGLVQLFDRLQRAKITLDDLLKGPQGDAPAPGQ